jgi:hypothetical protein
MEGRVRVQVSGGLRSLFSGRAAAAPRLDGHRSVAFLAFYELELGHGIQDLNGGRTTG